MAKSKGVQMLDLDHEIAKAAQAEVLPPANGAHVADDHLPPVPVSRNELFNRIRRTLAWQGKTLIAAARPPTSALAEPQFTLYVAELCDGGRVKQVDLVELAVSLGVLSPREETCVANWTEEPTP